MAVPTSRIWKNKSSMNGYKNASEAWTGETEDEGCAVAFSEFQRTSFPCVCSRSAFRPFC